ncbi:uncharacterized protein DUF3159 [Mumia flava]|uniref:Uncharacterized protein DUF3159 n=1 Tax=Mumia flava TaxID=1348852 RepID=A0A2M9B6V1_9ACTN|nr:DUF3159 domain-containing protein [Mumia flava]PJJ53652.1 uncharacterized protein DUF3159 [Mumia flava]
MSDETTSEDGTAQERPSTPTTHATVEQVVRARLAQALGGVRGMVETAIPTIGFTLSWIITRDLERSLWIGGGLAVVALLVRIVQRSTPQFVINSLFGIGIAAVFALRSGEARDAFLPGLIYNGVYAVVLILTILVGHPLVGYLVGSVTGDLTGWRRDKRMVRLCAQLTWLLAIPCVLRVIVQYPLWAADQVALLGTAKIAMGWPLQVAALAAMAYLLGRNHTPIEDPAEAARLLSDEALSLRPPLQPRD